MTSKIFYMPYDPRHPNFQFTQMEYGNILHAAQKNQISIDHEIAKGNRAVQVWYDGGTSPYLSSCLGGDIYIRGHGMPGFDSIEGGRGGERVHATEIVDRLIASGLRKEFFGKIKCFNCHSAETGNPATDTLCVGPPFAQFIADDLFARGYRNCSFYGYHGSIDSMPKAGSTGTHKYIRVKQLDGSTIEGGRASDLRVQFTPAMPRPSFRSRVFRRLFR